MNYTNSAWPKEGCETLRFYISQRKISGLESVTKRVEKVQDLAKDAEEPDTRIDILYST